MLTVGIRSVIDALSSKFDQPGSANCVRRLPRLEEAACNCRLPADFQELQFSLLLIGQSKASVSTKSFYRISFHITAKEVQGSSRSDGDASSALCRYL